VPGNGEGRPGTPPGTGLNTQPITAANGENIVADAADVVDLEVERHWRRLRLTADAPVRCGPGPCVCYGVELGSGVGA
jgi:hypothetical protein